jgi:hypothetical protein
MNASIRRSIRSHLGRSAVVLVSAAVVASCNAATSSPSGSAAAVASAPVTAPPVAAPVPSPSASAGDVAASDGPASPLATAVATALDPCQLVTAADVSQLTGVSFADGSGQESTTEGHGKLCSYGQAGTVFQVIVGVAPDVATAKAGEQQAEAELQKAAANGLTVTELKGFADGVADAATLTGSKTFAGQTFAATALYLLKGTTYLGMSDIGTLGAKVASVAQMEDQAKVTLARLP